MKTLSLFGVYASFTLVALLCLSFFGGCGDREDGPVSPTVPLVSEEFKWPPGTTSGLWELTNADIAELLAISPPPDWGKTKDPELYNKYYFAQLLKQFGDIPEVRYVIAFLRKPGKNITLEQAIAYSEANYRLFPNEQNLRALEQIRSTSTQPKESKDELELAKKDPELFVEIQRERFIKRYGDIPEVHIYLSLLLKRLKGQPLTDKEKLAREKAIALFRRLDAQRADQQDQEDDD